LTFTFVFYIQFAIKEIRKAQQTVDIDQIILFIELIKVSQSTPDSSKVIIFCLSSFLLSEVGGLLLCFSIQSFIRTVICGSFLGKVLTIYGHSA
jgi:hypothetical protein